MIDITLYNNSSDNDEVHKRITSLTTRHCEIFEDCSIQRPRLKVAMGDNIINANYLYIPKFSRYYYIENMNIYDGAYVVIDARVDVLMSFWNSFKNSQCIAKRSSSNYDNMLEDTLIAKYPTSQYITRKFGTPFNPSDSGFNYVLTVSGGGN